MSESIRVLIVEDLPTDAELSEREVREALVSCEFRRVETREEYLAALDAFRPALIVSDYRMPLFDGMTALKLAVERCPEVPFIVLTGSMNEDTAVACIKAGAWDYVIKEHVKRLGPAVQSAMERQRAQMGRQHAEEKLRQNEAEYRSLFENMLEGYAHCQMLFQDGRPEDFVYLRVNPAFETLTGLKNVVGKKVSEVIPGIRESSPELFEAYGRVASTGQPERLEIYVGALDIWFSVAVYSPQRGFFVAVFDNITERKRAEEALRESEARFRDAFERSSIGKSLTGADGRLLNVNQALADMLGYSIEELQQGTFLDITHPDDVAESREAVRSIFAGERTAYRTEKRYRHRDGHFVFADVNTTLLRDNQGAPLCLITSIVDITDRKRAEAELAAAHSELERRVAERTAELLVANQELESFAHAVSHDLRSPLRGIDGWSQAVLEDYAPLLDQRGRNYLEMVRAETNRMARLIDNLLELSRVTRASMTRETVDLTAIAQELAASLRAEQPERAADLVVAPGMVVQGDAVLLRAALQNLLHNAWKFTGRRPRAHIEVGCTSEQGRTVYHVRDDGAGFDMRFAGKLFAPFQRLHSVDEFPGTGIGLAAVQRIIRRHGGKVWATAEVDQGATFYFTLTA